MIVPFVDCLSVSGKLPLIICEDCQPIPLDDCLYSSWKDSPSSLIEESLYIHPTCSPLFPRVSGSFLILWEADSMSLVRTYPFSLSVPLSWRFFLLIYNYSCFCVILYIWCTDPSPIDCVDLSTLPTA
jgi:hypothetical protein